MVISAPPSPQSLLTRWLKSQRLHLSFIYRLWVSLENVVFRLSVPLLPPVSANSCSRVRADLCQLCLITTIKLSTNICHYQPAACLCKFLYRPNSLQNPNPRLLSSAAPSVMSAASDFWLPARHLFPSLCYPCPHPSSTAQVGISQVIIQACSAVPAHYLQ